MGTDLKSAAIQLGKALNDPIANLSALSRSGIQFSKSQKAMVKELVESNKMVEAQKIILAELDTQFGGSARAARDTMGGALSALGNKFGDLFEASGKTSKAIADVINTFNSWIPSTTESEQKTIDLAKAATFLKIELEDLKDTHLDLIETSKESISWTKSQAERNQDVIDSTQGIIDKEKELAAAKQATIDSRGEDGDGGETKIERLAREAEETAAAQVEIDAAKQMGASLHFGIMHQIESEAALRSQKLKDKDAKGKLKLQDKETKGFIGMAMAGNKSVTELVRQAAIEQAKVKGKQAIINAYEFGTKTGGPWVGAAYAGLASVAVGGLISALKGGGEGAAAPAATVSSVPQPVAPVPVTDAGGATVTRETEVILMGGLHSDDDMRNLIERINEVNQDTGGTSTFVAVSR